MDLHSENPYPLMRYGIINSFPSLDKNIRTEVAIIGAGISGALTAFYLSKAGFDVTVVDRRHAGLGSTVASTSLLQYEIDIPLYELAGIIGKKKAVTSYLLGREAIYRLEDICTELGDKNVYSKRPSLQFASFKKDMAGLKKEFLLRKEAGISIQWMEEADIQKNFGFRKPAGLLSSDGAEADAYKITHLILDKYRKGHLRVYDHTNVEKIIPHKKSIELFTSANKKIVARWLVIACGYESQRYIPYKVENIQSTFAIASEPMEQKKFWYKNALIWETARPYLYLRATADSRILVGGKDVSFSDPIKRDKLIAVKSKALEKAFSRLLPGIPFKTDFAWAGAFGTTKDGLPYIGSIRQRPRTFFALGLGGNGITFSLIAAEIIKDILSGKNNAFSSIFSFTR